VSLDLLKEKGTPLDRQKFTWKELVPAPYSKLGQPMRTPAWHRPDERHRGGGASLQPLRRPGRNRDLQLRLADVRRVEQHEQTALNWLHPADQSPLETTLAYEQTAVEVTARSPRTRRTPTTRRSIGSGCSRTSTTSIGSPRSTTGWRARTPTPFLQGYTDVLPGGRPRSEHRMPADNLRKGYNRLSAQGDH